MELNNEIISLEDGLNNQRNIVAKFNQKNNNALRIIIKDLLGKKAKEIKYYRLYFIKGKAFIEESNVKEIENLNKTQLKMVGENYIEYYWITFHLNGMDEYKIAMFHKDFDHATGNLHVLPGAIQIWKKGQREGFKIENGEIKDGNCETKPQKQAKSGQIFMEDGWIPMPIKKEAKLSKDIYMLWFSMQDICNHLSYVIGEEEVELDEKCRAVHMKEFFSQDLKDQIYGQMQLVSGRGTYSSLKFKGEKDRIISGYKIVYSPKAGYLYDFDGKTHEYEKGYNKDLNCYTESPNEFIINKNEKNCNCWKLRYERCEEEKSILS